MGIKIICGAHAPLVGLTVQHAEKSLVVYHSRAEQAVDTWLWDGGGWLVVLTVVACGLLAVGICRLLDGK